MQRPGDSCPASSADRNAEAVHVEDKERVECKIQEQEAFWGSQFVDEETVVLSKSGMTQNTQIYTWFDPNIGYSERAGSLWTHHFRTWQFIFDWKISTPLNSCISRLYYVAH